VVIVEVLGAFYQRAAAIIDSKEVLSIIKALITVDEESTEADVSLVKIPTLPEALSHVIQQKSEPEPFALLEQLLTTDDPEGVMDNIYNRFIGG
jgi:hypothetical protein